MRRCSSGERARRRRQVRDRTRAFCSSERALLLRSLTAGASCWHAYSFELCADRFGNARDRPATAAPKRPARTARPDSPPPRVRFASAIEPCAHNGPAGTRRGSQTQYQCCLSEPRPEPAGGRHTAARRRSPGDLDVDRRHPEPFVRCGTALRRESLREEGLGVSAPAVGSSHRGRPARRRRAEGMVTSPAQNPID